jgi:hypothetical protein
MGNHLGVNAHLSTMAARNHSVGIAHVTVVPTNAKPGLDKPDDEDDEDA